MEDLIFQLVQVILLELLNFSWKLRHDRSMGYRGGNAWDLEFERPRMKSQPHHVPEIGPWQSTAPSHAQFYPDVKDETVSVRCLI